MSITNVFLAHTQLYANIDEITLHGDLPTYKMQNKIKTFKLLARIGKFYVIINNVTNGNSVRCRYQKVEVIEQYDLLKTLTLECLDTLVNRDNWQMFFCSYQCNQDLRYPLATG